MLGSMQDAEDQVQETYLRAWKSYGEFEGRSSLRTWLYRIATNVCLTALENRGRIPVPSGLPESGAADATFPEESSSAPGPALEPTDPAIIVASRDHRRRALLVAWKHLSGRQRAVLILRDVLNWQASEIADLLGTTATAVHSMLRRARAQLEAAPSDAPVAEEVAQRGFLEEYAAAFETGDISALVHLLHEDAVCERRPSSTVMTGRETILRFLARCPAIGECRMVSISVNGKPGFAVYRKMENGKYKPYTIDVLTITRTGFKRIEVLEDRGLFATFGLPSVLD
jgi:RNA polymerase sigma-70 factor (ECF subfamily)